MASRDASNPSLMIIADDLSGATDSAVACAVRGLDTIVALGELDDFGTAEAIAFDVDTRRLTRNAATAEMARFIRTHAKASNRILFKKIDSTLRGHVGPEMAALLDTLRHLPDCASGQRTVAILAPAFPALGRTTVGGRQRLNGLPLEDTDLWQREGMTGEACLLDMMSCAGLESKLVPLETIRAGADAIRAAMTDAANRIDVLVCDAETEYELAALAHASLVIGVRCVWVGSAGLIGHLVDAAYISRWKADIPQLVSCGGPLLFVIGSQSSVSHRQAELLAAEDVVTLTIEEATLDKEAAGFASLATRFAAALENGKDVLLLSTSKAAPPRFDGGALWAALRDLVAPHAGRIGGLFATGGETARAVLAGLGVTTLRPVVEIEHGIPLSIAGGPRPFLVITKAGAFGKMETMLNCRRVLHECGTTTFVPTFYSKVQRWPAAL
jgi:4-hydroxythreonine-4-phosphate dehydrogenase